MFKSRSASIVVTRTRVVDADDDDDVSDANEKIPIIDLKLIGITFVD